MYWTHPPGLPGRRGLWPTPTRTTPLSSIPCFAHFQGRRLPWLPTSQSRLAWSLSNTTSIARAFCKQFTGCSPRRTRASRRLIKRRPLDHSLLLFIPVQVHEAIMASGNSQGSPHGPDHLNILHLKHLGPTGISYLCFLFNLSLASAVIPSIWKQAIIIALLKAGKPTASDLSGLVSLRAQSFPLASLTSSFLTTPTLQTSIVPMQTNLQPSSPTTISTLPLRACRTMQLTLSSGRLITASRSPSIKAIAPCLRPTHTSLGSIHLCPAPATLSPSAGPLSFWESPLIPTLPSPPTSGERPNVPVPASASSRAWQGWAGDSPRRSSCSPTRC